MPLEGEAPVEEIAVGGQGTIVLSAKVLAHFDHARIEVADPGKDGVLVELLINDVLLGVYDQRPFQSLALQYVNGLPGKTPPIMVFPNDPDLGKGVMHEGPMSTRLGMKGIPPMAETVQLARDLALLEYTGGHLHVSTISTAGSVELIRQAKARKLKVTASVAAHNLLLDDGCLRGFETCYKVMPPLRDSSHIEALREGVKDGTIDAIVSDHRPEDREHKVLEFGPAAFGIIGLETAFAVANTALKGSMGLRRIVERFTSGPRTVLGIPNLHIEAGAPADLTFFDPDVDWTCAEADLPSRSHNTPFLGQRFTGRPIGIVGNGRLVLSPAYAHAVA